MEPYWCYVAYYIDNMLSMPETRVMSEYERTPAGAVLTDLVLDLFRLGSRMTTAGDRLVAELGLTSARWQVLGSIMAAQRPQSVAWLARDMGASRQNLQRIVNDLEQEGLVRFLDNPHHRRSRLVELTEQGRAQFDAAMTLQGPWADELAKGIAPDELAIAHRVIGRLLDRLEPAAE